MIISTYLLLSTTLFSLLRLEYSFLANIFVNNLMINVRNVPIRRNNWCLLSDMNKMKEEISDLKRRVPLSYVIKSQLDVKLSGSNGLTFTCKCPFHGDRNPSMVIHDDTGSYYCFSCLESGDAIEFIRKYKNISFREALSELRTLFNEYEQFRSSGYKGESSVVPPSNDPYRGYSRSKISSIETPLFEQTASDRDLSIRIKILLKEAEMFYREKLMSNVKAGRARLYLKKRSLSAKTAFDFKLGFAPSSYSWPDTLASYLIAKNVSQDDLIASGLVIVRDPTFDDKSPRYMPTQLNNFDDMTKQQRRDIFDRFRDRLMIPIHDHLGDVIGFGGRILDDTKREGDRVTAKYINSPESNVFKKGLCLFGLHLASRQIQIRNEVIVVEGYFDVMTMHENGVNNVVGCLGTAINIKQLQLLSLVTDVKNITIMMDNDKAGVNAAKRFCLKVLIPNDDMDLNIRIASFSALSIVRPGSFDNITVKDASELHDLVNHRETFANIIGDIIDQAIHWKIWLLNELILEVRGSFLSDEQTINFDTFLKLFHFAECDRSKLIEIATLFWIPRENLSHSEYIAKIETLVDLFYRIGSDAVTKSIVCEVNKEVSARNVSTDNHWNNCKEYFDRTSQSLIGDLRKSIALIEPSIVNIYDYAVWILLKTYMEKSIISSTSRTQGIGLYLRSIVRDLLNEELTVDRFRFIRAIVQFIEVFEPSI